MVWTIAGSDPSGGAGIQADLQTFRSFDVDACSIITAITAQNSFELKNIQYADANMIADQLNVLLKDFFPSAIKLGMIGNKKILNQIILFFKNYSGFIVYDPVIYASTGHPLQPSLSLNYVIKELLPMIDLLTPNIREAEILSKMKITAVSDIEIAAKKLLLYGIKGVLIKGGHFKNDFAQDYFANGLESFWISSYRVPHFDMHGSGCILSSAIAAAYALGHDEKNALILAKNYINQVIRYKKHSTLKYQSIDFPWVSHSSDSTKNRFSFPKINNTVGIYPIVDCYDMVKKLFLKNIKTIQLRIKNSINLEKTIFEAIYFAKKNSLKLYINDYWQLAIKYHAHGVHLGQEDILSADMKAIYEAGLYLGISTHDYFELAIALAFQPSYIAFGPIYPTTSKQMKFSSQGLEKLKIWRKLVGIHLIAIGGINLKNVSQVLSCNVDGIAMISAVNEFC